MGKLIDFPNKGVDNTEKGLEDKFPENRVSNDLMIHMIKVFISEGYDVRDTDIIKDLGIVYGMLNATLARYNGGTAEDNAMIRILDAIRPDADELSAGDDE